MNNPDLVYALCDQVKAEADALQKATYNGRNAVNYETKDMFTEIQISHVVHLQNLALALLNDPPKRGCESFSVNKDYIGSSMIK